MDTDSTIVPSDLIIGNPTQEIQCYLFNHLGYGFNFWNRGTLCCITTASCSTVVVTQPVLLVWCGGNMLVSVNVATLHQVRLVPRWVTVFGLWILGAESGTQV